MERLLFVYIVVWCAGAQQLVNSVTVTADTSQVAFAPTVVGTGTLNAFGGDANYFASPNGAMFDIYDFFSGKVASIPVDKQSKAYYDVSAVIFNANNGWLLLYNITDTTGYGVTGNVNSFFKLYNGTSVMLSDSSNAGPVYSGGNVYLETIIYYGGNYYNFKIWKIGTAPTSASSLSKAASSVAQPEAIMVPGGLKIIAKSASDGFTAVQLFDLAGRLTFSGKIQNGKPFVIPSSSLPRSPFATNIGGAKGRLFMQSR